MKYRRREDRKAYAMQRMVQALARAIKARTALEKARAARWVAAWGVISGIRSPGTGIRLRRSTLFDKHPNRRKPSSR